MRVESWNPNTLDQTFENVAMDRLVEGAAVIRDKAKQNLHGQLGRGKTTGINRPVYKTGRYAGRDWTARHFSELMRSIRIVRLKTESGRAFAKKRNVRVYAGNYLAYYADIFEFYRPFMRPAEISSLPEVKSIIGVTDESKSSNYDVFHNYQADPSRAAGLFKK